MMKKLILIAFLIVFAVSPLYAATKARVGSFDKGIGDVVGIGDLSSGNTVEVDDNGNLVTAPGAATASYGAGDRQVKASAGTVYAVVASSSGGNVTAGDRVVIKNGTTSAGDTLIYLETTNTRGPWSFTPAVGMEFDTGIYVDVNSASADIVTTVVYE